MKRITLTLLVLYALSGNMQAQDSLPDSLSLSLDSILLELPEVMIRGEHPIVKATQGKLVYDFPRLVANLPVDNAYDALKELPGLVEMNGSFQLAGQGITVLLDGKVSTLTPEQLNALLKSLPASRVRKAEVMYSAPARYQVRGAIVNLILDGGADTPPSLQGELHTAYRQKHYASLSERASLLYSSRRLSADLLYNYNYGRGWMGTEKRAIHTLSDGSKHAIELNDVSTSRSNSHHLRLGMDYTFAKDHLLSFVYTGQWSTGATDGEVLGTETSHTTSKYNTDLHNARLDYTTPFGFKVGGEFTSYSTPTRQLLRSMLGEEKLDFLSSSNQQIQKWRFYLSQEHTLGNGWGVNYGAHYTTTDDRSFQFYYNPETDALLPGNNLQSHRREQTLNGYGGFNKSFGDKLSLDASLAAEFYHTDAWNEWSFYPTVNLNYTLAPEHIFQFSLTSNKTYPDYWSVQQSIDYMGAYSEIQGNPLLKPASDYQATLSYILQSKYVFTGYFSHEKEGFVQTLYQSPDRLVEIYKVLNFDFMQQAGLQVTVPLKVKEWLDTRLTGMSVFYRQKNSHFWDTPFDRKVVMFLFSMNNTVTLSTKPDMKLTLSGMIRSKAIQGIYDLPASGNLDAALRYTFANKKAQITLKCDDLFNTSGTSPVIHFGQQNLRNHYLENHREFTLSFSYKFGGYTEKQRETVDTSRFK